MNEDPEMYKFATRRSSILAVFDVSPNIFPVPDTFRLGNVLVVRDPIFALVAFIVPATIFVAFKVPEIVISDEDPPIGSKASFAMLSYTYAEFFTESDILLYLHI